MQNQSTKIYRHWRDAMRHKDWDILGTDLYLTQQYDGGVLVNIYQIEILDRTKPSKGELTPFRTTVFDAVIAPPYGGSALVENDDRQPADIFRWPSKPRVAYALSEQSSFILDSIEHMLDFECNKGFTSRTKSLKFRSALADIRKEKPDIFFADQFERACQQFPQTTDMEHKNHGWAWVKYKPSGLSRKLLNPQQSELDLTYPCGI